MMGRVLCLLSVLNAMLAKRRAFIDANELVGVVDEHLPPDQHQFPVKADSSGFHRV